MAQQGKYLYCLIREKQPKKFNISGMEGKDIYTINKNGLAMVVSDLPFQEEILATRANLLCHEKVMEEIMKEYDVIPISFGTIVQTKEEIIDEILKEKRAELEKLFQVLAGKIELGLKASWVDMKSVFQEIAKSSPIIQQLKKSKNVSYQERISTGELVGKLLESRRDAEKEKILKYLEAVAEDFKENKVLADDMILNTAFLVRKNKEKEFDRKINELGVKYEKRIKFAYVGPLPPFNFAKISF